jgi:hypothetical protein
VSSDAALMRKLTFIGFVVALSLSVVVMPGIASAKSTSWNAQANSVCVVWLAKAQKLFATPVKPSGLYKFAVSARALESQELAVLKKIPNPSAAGTHALGVMRADIAEVSSAISAADRGDSASFVRILKQYLNDHRAKAAFAAAGATQCG